MENKQSTLIIRLPRIDFKSLLTFRFFLYGLCFLALSSFLYWYLAIRPILWISDAQIETSFSHLNADHKGRISDLYFEEGDRVSKGQLFFVLDDDFLLGQQKQLKAKICSLKEQIQTEKLRIEKAMQQYLFASNEIDFATESSDVIEKNVAILEEAQTKSEAATNLLSAVELEAAAIDSKLNKMKVEAPFDGVVLKRWKNSGEMVSPGETVYTLFDQKKVWIGANISEVYLSKIELGLPVKIRLPAYPKREWSGRIERISPIATDLQQKPFVRLNISIDSGDFFLRPGLSASVALKVR